jgi:Laminin B (Domain IV)
VRFLVTGLVVLCSACGGISARANSVFETDDEGWTIGNNGDATAPMLNRAGGNPDGHICGQDQKDGDLWYFVAPSKYLGNASSVYGKRLTFDLKQGAINYQVRARDVVLNGGGLAISWNARANPGLDWTPRSVRLDDQSGWMLDDGTTPASESDLRMVLGSLTSLRLRGEFFDGPLDTACLDNVYFGRD